MRNNIIVWLFLVKAPLGLTRWPQHESPLAWDRQVLNNRKYMVINRYLVQTMVTGRRKAITCQI